MKDTYNKVYRVILGIMLSAMMLSIPSFSMDFGGGNVDPDILMNYMPQSQLDRNSPEAIMQNFQATLIQSVFLEPSIGQQANLFGSEDDSLSGIDSNFATQMMMHQLAHDMAKKDLFQLNKVLNRGLSTE